MFVKLICLLVKFVFFLGNVKLFVVDLFNCIIVVEGCLYMVDLFLFGGFVKYFGWILICVWDWLDLKLLFWILFDNLELFGVICNGLSVIWGILVDLVLIGLVRICGVCVLFLFFELDLLNGMGE